MGFGWFWVVEVVEFFRKHGFLNVFGMLLGGLGLVGLFL